MPAILMTPPTNRRISLHQFYAEPENHLYRANCRCGWTGEMVDEMAYVRDEFSRFHLIEALSTPLTCPSCLGSWDILTGGRPHQPIRNNRYGNRRSQLAYAAMDLHRIMLGVLRQGSGSRDSRAFFGEAWNMISENSDRAAEFFIQHGPEYGVFRDEWNRWGRAGR